MNKQAVIILASVGLTSLAHADPHKVFDTFLTQGGGSHVQITDCGDGSPCGTVIWINPSTLPAGETVTTVKGRNGELILGQKILTSFNRKSKDWRGGTIYDPENDKRYAARLKRMADGNLQIKGCIGPICQTQIWELVDETSQAATVTDNTPSG